MDEGDDFTGDDETGGGNRFLDGTYDVNARPSVSSWAFVLLLNYF